MLAQYLVSFAILLTILLVHEYATKSKKNEGGWMRALVLAILWTGASYLTQQFGIIAWIFVLPLLIMALRGIMGYSTVGSFFFVLFISLIFQGILTIEALQFNG